MKYNYYVRKPNSSVLIKVSGRNKFDLYLCIMNKCIDPMECVLLTMDKRREIWYDEFFINGDYYSNRYFEHTRFRYCL